MARRSGADELEVIDLEAEGGAATSPDTGQPSPFRWRRPLVIVPIVLAALVAAVVGPVRATMNNRALERLERVVVLSEALEEEAEDGVVGLVRTAPGVGDQVFLDALRTLTDAQQHFLRRLDGDLPRALLLDDRLRTARDELAAYLDARIAELQTLGRRGPGEGISLAVGPDTMRHRLRADRALAAERARRGGARAEARIGDVELPSLEDEREALRRPTDDPVGLSLLASGIDGPTLLDLDTGHTTGDGEWAGETPPVVSGATTAWTEEFDWFERTGELVPDRAARLRDDTHDLVTAWTARLRPLGDDDVEPVTVERVVAIVASPRPDAFWTQEIGLDGSMTVREIDANAHTLTGPAPLPSGSRLFGASRSGLVLAGDQAPGDSAVRVSALVLWQPVEGRTIRQIGDARTQPLSLGGDTLLWSRWDEDDGPQRFVTNLDSGVDRPLADGDYEDTWAGGAVSPDGNLVAIANGREWTIVELASGATHTVEGEPQGVPAWSPDSRHAILPSAVRAYGRGAVIRWADSLLRWDLDRREAGSLRLRGQQWPQWGFAIVETP